MSPDRIHEAESFLLRAKDSAVLGIMGDLCLDRFVFGSVDRISPEAPVPVLLVDKSEDRLGCSANVSTNLAALRDAFPLKQKLWSLVGDDVAGRQILEQLKALGQVDTTGLVFDKLRPTTLKTRFLAGSQHQLLRVDEEQSLAISEALQDAILKNFEENLFDLKILVIQDYAKGLLSEGFAQKVISLAKAKGVKVLVDPHRKTPASAYLGAYLLKPNVQEAEILLEKPGFLQRGRDDRLVSEACRELKKKLNLEMCLITRSGHGMTLLDQQDQITQFPALARSVFDVTGAGDTVVAVLAASLACGADPKIACSLATAAASVVVAKVGTATASPSEILQELLRGSQ